MSDTPDKPPEQPRRSIEFLVGALEGMAAPKDRDRDRKVAEEILREVDWLRLGCPPYP